MICPLEWGLGHASRCVPLAGELKSKGHEIVFAAGENHLAFLKGEFPDAEFLIFPGFNPSYSRYLPMWLTMVFKSPSLLYHIIKEHVCLEKIIRDNKINAVISDNRFGLWNSGVKSVYITHQLRIKFPKWTLFLEPLIAAIHKWVIKKYDYCLVPDLPGELNFTGELSHGIKLFNEVRFIGLLSRFSDLASDTGQVPENRKEYVLLILSGPEPQKSIFKNKIIGALKDRNLELIILGAEPDGNYFEKKKDRKTISVGDNRYRMTAEKNDDEELAPEGLYNFETFRSKISIRYYRHLPAPEIQNLIINSKAIITRSGYTTIMELISLGRTALLVPTPGQTEQEYLGKTLNEKRWFTTLNQNKIDNKINLNLSKPSWHLSIMVESSKLLKETLNTIF